MGGGDPRGGACDALGRDNTVQYLLIHAGFESFRQVNDGSTVNKLTIQDTYTHLIT